MNQTDLNALKLGYRSSRHAKWALKLASYASFVPLTLTLVFHMLVPRGFYDYLEFNEISLIILYATNIAYAVFGFFMLKEKVWAANIAFFLLGGTMIMNYYFDRELPSGFWIVLLLLLVNAIRAAYYLKMYPNEL
ncbi:hypothetical protein [Vibrio mimicus]|uniref:hypothetical protein n=1 Tax=Vibrio mimicus TaxID=674 RepID=UPI0011D9EE75|nr:hypothetical protein [Vibrio mimicus]TXY46128.1 hypothetical protein FXE78_11305 [Vibrio mimicus]